MEDKLELYSSYLKRRKSPDTYKMYMWVAKKFVEFVKANGLKQNEIKLADVEGFLSTLKASDRSTAFYSYALASFLKFIGLEHLASMTPISRFETSEPAWMSPQTVRKLINACEKPEHKALLWLAYELALRVSEAVSIKWEDVDLRNRTVTVTRMKKKRVERKVKPISRELAELLATLPRLGEYVFMVKGGRKNPGLHKMSSRLAMKIFKEAAERIGLKGYTFHSLRHSRATEIAEKTGGNPIEVAKVTDHDDPRSVLIYCHIALRRLREIMAPEPEKTR